MDDVKKALADLYDMIIELQDRFDRHEEEYSFLSTPDTREIILNLLRWGFSKEDIMEFFSESNPLIEKRNSELIDEIKKEKNKEIRDE